MYKRSKIAAQPVRHLFDALDAAKALYDHPNAQGEFCWAALRRLAHDPVVQPRTPAARAGDAWALGYRLVQLDGAA
jgi:hypothetical protein